MPWWRHTMERHEELDTNVLRPIDISITSCFILLFYFSFKCRKHFES